MELAALVLASGFAVLAFPIGFLLGDRYGAVAGCAPFAVLLVVSLVGLWWTEQ